MNTAVEVLLFTKYGTNPVYVEPQIDYVAWMLNREGRASMFMPYTDVHCTPDILALGNRVLIRFGNGLPQWGGVIDEPRKRLATGVRITCYTADRILSWRKTPQTYEAAAMTPGEIAAALLAEANTEWETGVLPGSIYEGGTPRDQTYHYHNLADMLQQLTRLSGQDLEYLPFYENNTLVFYLNWFSMAGIDRSDQVLLIEDRNLVVAEMDEQGPIASKVICAGGGAGGTTWDDRLIGVAESVASRNAWGYRQYMEVMTGVFGESTLIASAEALLAEMQNPRGRYKLAAMDELPAKFADYDVGDTVSIEAFLSHPLWAVKNAVRVIGREWTPDNLCRLEVQ